MIDFEKISSGILQLLADTASLLPEQNIADAHDLLQHEEFGEALSLICTQLYEYDVPIAQETYDQIELIGESMDLPSDEWSMLQHQIKRV